MNPLTKLTIVLVSVLLVFHKNAKADNPFSTSFNFHFGLTSGGMKSITFPENPLVFQSRIDQLSVGFGRNGGIAVEKMKWTNKSGETKPSWGFRGGFQFHNFEQEFTKSTLEKYHFKYIRIPIEVMVCVFSKKAYVRDDDQINISGDNITFHKGLGVIQTRNSVFLTGGYCYSSLKSLNFEGNTSFGPQYQDSFSAIRKNVSTKDPAFQIGIEYRTGGLGLQIYYQESLRSIYSGTELKNGFYAFLLKFIL